MLITPCQYSIHVNNVLQCDILVTLHCFIIIIQPLEVKRTSNLENRYMWPWCNVSNRNVSNRQTYHFLRKVKSYGTWIVSSVCTFSWGRWSIHSLLYYSSSMRTLFWMKLIFHSEVISKCNVSNQQYFACTTFGKHGHKTILIWILGFIFTKTDMLRRMICLAHCGKYGAINDANSWKM